MLDAINPFVQQFRAARDIVAGQSVPSLKMILLGSRHKDGRLYNLPASSEVAALIEGDIDDNFSVRDVIIKSKNGFVQRINELHPAYLPLQYPLLFPHGEDGYRDDVPHREESLAKTKLKKRVSIREFLAYRLMHKENEISHLLHSSKLLQQFIVDVCTMMESQRLLWVKTHQKDLRVELYQGLSDAVLSGETSGSSVGKKIILPSSFTGGARYMMGNYQDAMAICRSIGYPDLFITFTCNSSWPEVTRYCAKQQLKPSDCPQILTRIFHMKLKALMRELKKGNIFGKVRAGIFFAFLALFIYFFSTCNILLFHMPLFIYSLFANH